MQQQQGRNQALSEINVTPLVDVMLVLLVIFMVTAPLLQQGLDVNLPQSKGKDLRSNADKNITVTIKKNGKLYLDGKVSNLKTLRTELSGKKDKTVYLKADKKVPYGLVAEVIGELKDIGVEKLGMVTVPRSSKK